MPVRNSRRYRKTDNFASVPKPKFRMNHCPDEAESHDWLELWSRQINKLLCRVFFFLAAPQPRELALRNRLRISRSGIDRLGM